MVPHVQTGRKKPGERGILKRKGGKEMGTHASRGHDGFVNTETVGKRGLSGMGGRWRSPASGRVGEDQEMEAE